MVCAFLLICALLTTFFLLPTCSQKADDFRFMLTAFGAIKQQLNVNNHLVNTWIFFHKKNGLPIAECGIAKI